MKIPNNLPLKNMPADALSSIDDHELLERSKARLRVVDVADDVASKLSVVCALMDSDRYSELEDNDKCCAERLIIDTLNDCIDLIRSARGSVYE